MVDYLIPSSVKEVLKFINENKSKMISGGTDLMVQRRNWADVKALFDEKEVYIFNLTELKYINSLVGELHIGATTPVSDILNDERTPKLLKESIEIMASPALRNLATLPGNIMNASPAGDTLPILYVLDAKAVIESVDGRRIEDVEQIITGPRKTILKQNEMITEIIIPFSDFTHQTFVKVGGRKADAISKLSFTGAAKVVDGVVEDLRIAFGAVGPLIVRKREIENKYIGLTVKEIVERIQEVIEDYSPFITPIDDQRSSKEYRKKVSINLVKDFIERL